MRGVPATLQSGDGSPATGVDDVTYTRDDGGRITTVGETIASPPNPTTPDTRSARYTYDDLGRLACVYHDEQLVAHHLYDDNGNRIGASATCGTDTVPAGITGASVVEAAGIGSNNQLDAATVRDVFGGEHQYTYGYDATGALATKVEALNSEHPNTLTTLYTYDAYGNLRHVTLPDGRQIDYLIDAANRRVGKLANGVRVQGFLYQDAIRPIAELDATNGVSGIFVYGSKGNVPDYIDRGDTRYRLISDNVGSVRLVINTTTGAIEQRLDYDEWGNVIQDTNPGFQPFGFAGGLYDPDTKLVRFGARDYDGEVGRWTSRDLIGFEGVVADLYGYTDSDPLNSADPSGLTDVRIEVQRMAETRNSTPGILTVTAGSHSLRGVTLELPDRRNAPNVSRVPAGTYSGGVQHSERLGNVVRLYDVPGRSNILIHAGNTVQDTEGCILPGELAGRDTVARSRNALQGILSIIDQTRTEDAARGEHTTITVHIANPGGVR